MRRNGRRMGRKYPSSSDSWGLGERQLLSQWDGGAQAEFNLRRSLPLTARDSKFFTFCPEKWRVLHPSVQKVGVPVPLVSPVNYAYGTPYTKFEHFGIVHYWVMLRTNRQTDGAEHTTHFDRLCRQLVWITMQWWAVVNLTTKLTTSS